MMNFPKTENHNLLWSCLIIDELVKSGVNQFYLSPGLRNAPLVAAVKSCPEANYAVGIDERAQSFRALGFGKSTGKAAALICTSGTALANYFPAVIEAKKSGVPLLIISADRPDELVVSGANQSIDQKHIYGNFANAFMNTGTPDTNYSPRALRTSITSTLWQTQKPAAGPVHINVSFREPLDNSKNELDKNYLQEALETFKSSFASTTHLTDSPIRQLPNMVMATLQKAKRPLVVVGGLPAWEEKDSIKSFLNGLKCPFYLDVTSGLKYQYGLDDGLLPSFDHPEVIQNLEQSAPDLIIHIGGPLVSKQFYKMLEKNHQIPVLAIQDHPQKEDPAHSIHLKWNTDIPMALLALRESNEVHLEWGSFNWEKWQQFAKTKRELIDQSEMAFPVISKTLVEILPKNAPTFIGNSTAIRSFDSYIDLKGREDIHTYANRGVSGIEGHLASALGISEGLQTTSTLILGDISFLHDLGSLQMLKSGPGKVIVILINNFGGGIFKLLPISKTEIIQEISTPHQINFKAACDLFDLPYKHVLTKEDLKSSYQQALKSNKSTIIEVTYDEEINTKLYQSLKTIKL